jgi:hypothetical protein
VLNSEKASEEINYGGLWGPLNQKPDPFSLPLSRRCHNISSIPWAFYILLCPLLTSVTRWARLTVRSVPLGTRNGSPGVIPATFDARLSDLPNTGRQRIEDFAVCCRLVPPVSSLYPLAVRQPASLPEASFRLALPRFPCPRLAFASVGAGPRL